MKRELLRDEPGFVHLSNLLLIFTQGHLLEEGLGKALARRQAVLPVAGLLFFPGVLCTIIPQPLLKVPLLQSLLLAGSCCLARRYRSELAPGSCFLCLLLKLGLQRRLLDGGWLSWLLFQADLSASQTSESLIDSTTPIF